MSNFHTSFHQKRQELNFHYLMDSALNLPNVLKVMYAFYKFLFLFQPKFGLTRVWISGPFTQSFLTIEIAQVRFNSMYCQRLYIILLEFKGF